MKGMGPLAGVKVIEIAALGPTPFAGMLLSDMGAEVIRLERSAVQSIGSGAWNHMHRGRPSVECDLSTAAGRELVLTLVESADALIEGFRPGVMEKHGLGPEVIHARNPRVVYCRATGYGQDGPLSARPGHDINYISMAGVLGAIARPGTKPTFPLSLLGDFGGGGMLVAFGLLCGVLEARQSGLGQVVDASMVEGTALLSTVFHALRNAGMSSDEPGTNYFDGGAHFYNVYETSDGGFVAVGAVEPQFYAAMLRELGLPSEQWPQWESSRWPELSDRLAQVFRTRTRDEWARTFESSDACISPVYRLGEAAQHSHNIERNTFVDIDGHLQPAPAPRFSRSIVGVPSPAPEPGSDTRSALIDWGLSTSDVDRYLDDSATTKSTRE